MTLTNRRASRPELNEASLKELALKYVGRYGTTRGRLEAYLVRKVRERGWAGGSPPDLEGLTHRFAELGLVDDRAYALAKSRALVARGYGRRRLTERLRVDGVDDDDTIDAQAHADEQAVEAALRFAKRRRIGPYSPHSVDARGREKWIAALLRAGHGFTLARAIASLSPGDECDLEVLGELAGSNKN